MKLSPSHNHLPKHSLLITALLLLLSSVFTSFFFLSKPSTGNEQKQLQDYVWDQQQKAKQVLDDTSLITKLVLHAESQATFNAIRDQRYGLFLFTDTSRQSPHLAFWSNQKIVPSDTALSLPDGTYFQYLLNGYYVVQKTTITLASVGRTIIGFVMIPVLNKYYLQSKNSLTEFAHNSDAINTIALSNSATNFPIKAVDGKPLFFITPVSAGNQSGLDAVTLMLRLSAMVLLLVYLHLFVDGVRKRGGTTKAILLLTAALLLLRLLLFYFPSLLLLRQFTLFDPTVYAANYINHSLGDLLLNALFLCWIILFTWESLGPIKRLPNFFKGKGIIAAGVAGIFILIFTSFQLANLVHDLVANSKVSFQVINFFGLDIYTVFGFIVLAVLSLTYYYFSRLLFRFILLAFSNLVYLYFAVAIIGLVFLTARSGDSIVLFHLPVLVWLVMYTLLLTQEQLIINRFRITIAGILFWIFIFSLSLAVLIVQGNREKEWRERKAIAEKADQLSDPSKEHTLSIALTYLDNRFLHSNFSRFYKEPDNRLIRDSIINTNSLGYTNLYNTGFFVFDSANRPVNNEGQRTYAELSNILDVQSKPTGMTDLFYYETSYDQFVYITKKTVYDSSHFVGTIFILAMPKQFQNADALYPNLFRQDVNDIETSSVYSYAVYKRGKLLNHSSKYFFHTVLGEASIPANETTRIENEGYDELWYKPGNQKIIIVAKKKDSLLEGITLFSYLFCAFLFMVGILQLASFLVEVAKDWRSVNLFAQLTIRTQIHGTIIFISVLSFLIIGVATITFFIMRYSRNNIDRLSLTAGSTVKELEKHAKASALITNNHWIDFSDSASMITLRSEIQEIADVHGVIVNLYDTSGTLQVTSDETIYKNGVLSTRMDPTAYYHLNTVHEVQRVQEEKVSRLDYLSIYSAIRNENGDTYAYLNIPSFTSQIELNQEISNFLVTIINLNAFIFLIAGIIALFITDRIARSFSVIGNKMKAITLGQANEEIVWTKKDEIGALVAQYNKMVQQLGASAEALAKSEREGAWREMARQVAHEIKNPLTPMKLSIQYLQKAIQNNLPNVQQLTSSVATTLIEQIDHLSKIAADFSQFANIGNKRVERIDLHAVIGSLVALYRANPKINLVYNPLPGAIEMYADKTQMNRLFTNLLTNAVDACSERRQCVVTINEEVNGDGVMIAIQDNGEGIPKEVQAKIFTPNFTTKTSGTGLGLAMCKSIAEQAGGAIWFKTEEGEGATFYVQLPLVN